jgi:mannose-1-phosphate guanylyltransferase
MLAIASVLTENPDATVLLTPCDHAFADVEAFRRGVLDACRAVGGGADAVLLGVDAEGPATDYGWIVRGRALRSGAHRVLRFVEKPALEEAQGLLAAGAIWNTMVLVARARALWEMLCSSIPGLDVPFLAAAAMTEPSRSRFLSRRYARMPSYDFSADVLGRSRNLAAVAWPQHAGWTDLGTPSRLLEWMRRVHAV